MTITRDLERQADELLRAHDSGGMVINFDKGTEIFDPFVGFGDRLRAMPQGASIRQPSGLGSGKKAATIGPPCERCGKPRSKYAVSLCRSCFGAKAVERYEDRIRDKWRRQEEHLEKYSWLVENYITYWLEFHRVGSNFADQLINDISRWEEHIGIPFALWDKELEFRAVEDARDLPERIPLPPRQLPSKNRQKWRQMQTAWRYAA